MSNSPPNSNDVVYLSKITIYAVSYVFQYLSEYTECLVFRDKILQDSVDKTKDVETLGYDGTRKQHNDKNSLKISMHNKKFYCVGYLRH